MAGFKLSGGSGENRNLQCQYIFSIRRLADNEKLFDSRT